MIESGIPKRRALGKGLEELFNSEQSISTKKKI